MAATDSQSLLAAANCYQCFSSNPYSQMLAKLALLKQILLTLDPMADTSPQALLSQANCFTCYGNNPYTLTLMELALLVNILNTGIGGGGGQLVIYTTTDPTTDGVLPTDQTQPALAYKQDGGGPLFIWRTDTHVWA